MTKDGLRQGAERSANNLDVLRLAFALLVILSHSYPILYGNDDLEPLHRLTRGQLTLGDVAVAFFFIVSGFLITQSFLRSRSVFAYFQKRVARIYPGFIVCFLVCYFLVVPLSLQQLGAWPAFIQPAQWVIWPLLLYMPGIAGAFAGNPMPGVVNGSAWTIKYEFVCYIVIAALGVLHLLTRRRFLLVAFALCLAAQALVLVGAIHFPLPIESGRTFMLVGDLVHYPRFLSYFLAGAVYFAFKERIPRSAWLVALCALILIVFAWFTPVLDVALAVAGAYIIFYLGFHKKVVLKGLTRQGDFSYGTYLYAFPIQQLLVQFVGVAWSPVLLFVAASILTFGVAVFSWRWVEQPAMAWAAGWTKRRVAQPPAAEALAQPRN